MGDEDGGEKVWEGGIRVVEKGMRGEVFWVIGKERRVIEMGVRG